MKKLWEYLHPYYMTKASYHDNKSHHEYSSFDDFLEEWGEADIQYNRIHRWDFAIEPDDKNDENDPDSVTFFYVIQRKAHLISCTVDIDKEKDHDRILEFLKPHAEQNNELWAGVK